MKYRKVLTVFLILVSLGCCKPVFSAQPLKVVTTQTMYAEVIKQIGKEKVEVHSVALPQFNVHFIQPKPSDVRNVAKADLYVNAGLDLEAWSGPLLEAAGKVDLFQGGNRNLDLSKGIQILNRPDHPQTRAEGDIHLFGNPHYNMNPENEKIMAEEVLEKLKEIDPENASYYEENAKDFTSKLDRKIAEWKTLCDPYRGQEIISYHEDIAYFADFLGLKAEQFLEPKPGIPPTPQHLEHLARYIQEKHIKAIVLPTYYPKDAAEVLSKKVGAKVVTICQNVGEIPEAGDIFSFFDYNFKQISEALR